jgi:tyrosine-protein kinase Etk/Wzc
MKSDQLNNNTIMDEENDTNFRESFDKYIFHWKYFLLGLAISVAMVLVYLRYVNPVYESKASILIKDEQKGGSITDLSMFKDLGISGGNNNVQNEIEILKSRILLNKCAEELGLNKKIVVRGNRTGIKKQELYSNRPFVFKDAEDDSLLYDKECAFEIVITSSNTLFINEIDGKSFGEIPFGDPVKSSVGNLIFSKTPYFNNKWIGRKFDVRIEKMNDIVTDLQENITVETVNKDSYVLRISLRGETVKKNDDILNELIRQHEKQAINDKNEISTNTNTFINDRMKFLSVELSGVEKEGEKFKSEHSLVDVTSDAAVYLSKESTAEKVITEASIQLRLADYINDYLNSHQGYADLLPANLGFEDQSVVAMTNQYNLLVLERNKLLLSSVEKNPAVLRIQGQLSGLRASLLESLHNVKSSIQMKLKTLKAQENLYQSKISSIPKYEREYRNIMRQQQIKETLFIYLLQKREENEIALVATVGNAKVVDYAYCNGKPVSPKKTLIYLGAILMGILIPAGIIYLKDLFDTKVHSNKDIESLHLPLVGEIPINTNNEKIIAFTNSTSVISEAFRLVRMNANFMIQKEANASKTILITSTLAGEGKSFTSINLGHIFSNSGKKSVVVGLDLRKPILDKYANIEVKPGVSNFIVNEELTIDDILIQDINNENISYVLSGSIPPNPSELLMRERLNQLFHILKERFEYVIIDTAPVGLVADTLYISKFADLVIYVVRANYLDKRLLTIPQKLFKENKLGVMAVLLNGVSMKGYGYGYGYGAYQQDFEKSKRGLFKRNKRNV